MLTEKEKQDIARISDPKKLRIYKILFFGTATLLIVIAAFILKTYFTSNKETIGSTLLVFFLSAVTYFWLVLIIFSTLIMKLNAELEELRNKLNQK